MMTQIAIASLMIFSATVGGQSACDDGTTLMCCNKEISSDRGVIENVLSGAGNLLSGLLGSDEVALFGECRPIVMNQGCNAMVACCQTSGSQDGALADGALPCIPVSGIL